MSVWIAALMISQEQKKGSTDFVKRLQKRRRLSIRLIFFFVSMFSDFFGNCEPILIIFLHWISIVSDWSPINFVGIGPFLLCMFAHSFLVYESILIILLRLDQYSSKVVKILFLNLFYVCLARTFYHVDQFRWFFFYWKGGTLGVVPY